MKNIKLLLNIKVILLSLCLILSGCSKESEEDKKDILIVGTSADNPPFEFIEAGKITGFEMDLIDLIGSEMGYEVQIKNIDFPGLIPALISSNIDLSIAGFSVTPERLENVDFSDTYYSSEIAILFRNDSGIDINTDLSQKIIGAQFGTTWESFAKSILQNSNSKNLRSLRNNLQLIQELNNKNIDLVVLESNQVEKFKENYSNLSSFNISSSKSEFAIALPKNSRLTLEVNKAIELIRKNGKFDELKAKWFK
jgi:ABC-type amino acid transport substrate-binding protein